MSSSTLDLENRVLRDRELDKGHGTAALGPSDSSDSGSDIAAGDAGRELGDADLTSDTDAEGTGERGSAGRAETSGARDIGVDRIVRLNKFGVLVPDGDELPPDLEQFSSDLDAADES